MQNQSVVVLTPNGRRQTVKVDPNKTILEILEFVCQKHNFLPDDYNLKHHNKVLDLSTMFRYSGLPNNCNLEMIECDKKRVESEIEVCFQFEDNSRKNGNFKSSTKLMEIVQQLCPEKGSSDQNPIVIYMRKEVFGNDLESTSLKSLGLTSGKAMFRFLNKNPEELKTQANVSAPLPQKPKEEVEQTAKSRKVEANSAATSVIVTPEVIKSLKTESVVANKHVETEEMEVDDEPENVKVEEKVAVESTSKATATEVPDQQVEDVPMPEPEIHMLDERGTIIFSLDSVETPNMDLPDSFFELTEQDVRKLYRDLRHQVSEYEEAPLKTSELRKLEEDQRILTQINTYKKCVLRIQFPNRYVLQSKFSPVEKIEDVMTLVKSYLKNPEIKFYLYVTPPKTVLETNLNLLEANCVPNALLHLGLEDESQSVDLLKPELYDKLTTALGASVAVAKIKSELKREKSNTAGSSGTSKPKVPDNFLESSASAKTAKLPKWLKTGK